jgi:hypothetical protein
MLADLASNLENFWLRYPKRVGFRSTVIHQTYLCHAGNKVAQ